MTAKIIGTGRVVPDHVYDNADMARIVGAPPQWTGGKIERLLGIKERRFAVPISHNRGRAAEAVDEVQLATEAAHRALVAAEREPKDIDMVCLVSCTAQKGERRHFQSATFKMHQSLGLSENARIHEMDAGCGGVVHAIEQVYESILSGRRKLALVVASTCTSQYIDRDFYQETGAWLSPLIFADGAAAVVLEKTTNGAGIREAVTFVDSSTPLMNLAGDPKRHPELAYSIDAATVKRTFAQYTGRALDELRGRYPSLLEADLFIFHQVNKRVLEDFVRGYGLPADKVPINVHLRGNIAAAATLDILDEEIRAGRIGKGSRIVICTVGAGAQFGALAITL